MSDHVLPTAEKVRARSRVLDCLVSIPAMLVIVSYLQAMLHLRFVSRYLVAKQEGQADERTCRDAFSSVISLPRSLMQFSMGQWMVATAFIPVVSWAIGLGHWGFDHRLLVLLLSGFLGGIVSSAFIYFGAKEMMMETRAELAADISDPEVRAALVRPTSISSKVRLVVVGSVVATAVLSVSLAHSRLARGVENEGLKWQARVLEVVEADLGGWPLEVAIEMSIPDDRMLRYPIEIEWVDIEARAADVDEATAALHESIRVALAADQTRGRMAGGLHPDRIVWRQVEDGRILSARAKGSAYAGGDNGFPAYLLAAILFAGAVALYVAQLVAGEFKRGAQALTEEAGRLAGGDLRPGRAWEAEDEMGVLARSFEQMAASLRSTVGRVSEAADRVDSTASEISAVSQSVGVASADQVRRIQQANELMIEIKDQVAGVSTSARELNDSVEESSSSILELGAASDELNDTASLLSGKVEEVSGSIEQMVRSVKQVSATTEHVSQAAGDTSSSMEEMASAMRVVDTNAELTANLSRDVVNLAETGQQKVSQTIAGMQAISDATEAAERVIHGLGDRAKEIGGILDVIDDVADETNLLALNAAIIAAQAGEHGRAFSVVADEIKELADRVLASTKEIGGLIRSVQAESENAIGAIEAGSQSVASGVELSAEAGTALEEITRASRESGMRISDIVSAVREQTKATVHVVSLMEGVRDGVEQISVAGSEQDRGNEVVYRSAVTMKDVAQQVRRTTEEQSRGFGQINISIETVRGTVESINHSLGEQTSANSQVASFLEQVFEGTRSNEEAARRMDESMRDLLAQAEALREDVAKFKL